MSGARFDYVRKLVRGNNGGFLGNVPDDVRCSMCEQVMINAHCARCGCRFCLDCVTHYLGERPRFCPGNSDECKEQLMDLRTSVQPDYAVHRKILKLLVRCPLESCDFQGELGKMEEHERVCRRQTSDCPYRSVGCQEVRLANDGVGPHLAEESEAHARLLMECIGTLQNESASMARDVADLRDEIGALRLERDRQQRVLTRQSTEIECLNREMQAAKTDGREMKERLRSLEEENEAMRGDNNDLYTELEEIRSEHWGIVEAVNLRYEEFVARVAKQASAMEKECQKSRRGDGELVQLDRDADSVGSWRRKPGGEDARTPQKTNPEMRDDGDFLWQINSAVSWRRAARAGTETVSEPFYSHRNGYQMCMSTWAEGAHCSVGWHVMKGPFDHALSWPFKGAITVSIVDQDTGRDNDSYAMTSDDYPDDYRLTRPRRGRNNALSKRWIPLDDLLYNQALCKHGRVLIRCQVTVAR